jgi:hypothetical protein
MALIPIESCLEVEGGGIGNGAKIYSISTVRNFQHWTCPVNRIFELIKIDWLTRTSF